MTIAEEDEGEQTANYIRRRFIPCLCDAIHGDYRMGRCPCSTDEDGTVSHGGSPSESYEHEARGYPRRA